MQRSKVVVVVAVVSSFRLVSHTCWSIIWHCPYLLCIVGSQKSTKKTVEQLLNNNLQ